MIDFACGTGRNLPYLKAQCPGWIIGIDFSCEMLSRARKKYPDEEFIQADLTSFSTEKKAKRAICAYGLSMIEDWKTAILSMKDCLEPDGSLVLLDFTPLRGLLRPVHPLFRWWLAHFGVESDRDLPGFLRSHFHEVETSLPPLGYAQIIVARHPNSHF